TASGTSTNARAIWVTNSCISSGLSVVLILPPNWEDTPSTVFRGYRGYYRKAATDKRTIRRLSHPGGAKVTLLGGIRSRRTLTPPRICRGPRRPLRNPPYQSRWLLIQQAGPMAQ